MLYTVLGTYLSAAVVMQINTIRSSEIFAFVTHTHACTQLFLLASTMDDEVEEATPSKKTESVSTHARTHACVRTHTHVHTSQLQAPLLEEGENKA